jgi:hypothetical protein
MHPWINGKEQPTPLSLGEQNFENNHREYSTIYFSSQEIALSTTPTSCLEPPATPIMLPLDAFRDYW